MSTSADTGNNAIRELTPSGYIFAIGGPVFSAPTALQIDANSNIFVADTGHNNISEIIVANGHRSPVAGNGQNGSSGNGGAATAASLSSPTGLHWMLQAISTSLIPATMSFDWLMPPALINTVAGTLGQSGSGTLPGSANGLLLNLPGGVAATTSGKLYVLDSGNNRAFFIDRTSVVENLGACSARILRVRCRRSSRPTRDRSQRFCLHRLLNPSSPVRATRRCFQ